MNKGTSTRPEVFLALAHAYEIGNSVITDRIEAILTPNQVKLPDALQAALDSIGDTPISEPEKYGFLKDGNMSAFTAACAGKIDLDSFDAVIASTFLSRCRAKILTDVDSDGVFKTTPALDKMRLPKFSEVQKFLELAQKQCSEEELETEIFSVVGLDKNDLSQWEKELVQSIITSYSQVTSNAMLGHVTDRTPFSRYLKNT